MRNVSSVVSLRNLWIYIILHIVAATAISSRAVGQENAPTEPMRIIVFGAHPDDCELEAGGTAARWAKLGYKVKFVSVTNGDIGHHEMAGAILARRRTARSRNVPQILGIETEVLDIHDGELLPTLENRRTITRQIREWKADVVIAPRPNDYHPDHRYTGILVQDAAFMVIVPSFCPDVPALRKNPVFLYTEDDFKKPNPFSPDVVVPIDPVFDLKVACIDALESQFYEWNPWLFGYLDEVPKEKGARLEWTRNRAAKRYGGLADRFRPKLIELLGEEKGKAVKYAESFEICEYGSQPSRDELMRIFPFFESAMISSRVEHDCWLSFPRQQNVERDRFPGPYALGTGPLRSIVRSFKSDRSERRSRGLLGPAAAAEVVLIEVDDLDLVINVIERNRIVRPVELIVIDRALVVAMHQLAGPGERVDLAGVDLLADLLDQDPDVIALGFIERSSRV